MQTKSLAQGLFVLLFPALGCWAAPAIPGTDPLVAVDLHRNAIVGDIVAGFQSDVGAATPEARAGAPAELKARLLALRADRLLAASLASSYAALDSILAESERSQGADPVRPHLKALGDASADLVYTPLTPCRLIDTRGFGAPIQGGAFAPNARRSYVPNGLCGIPTAGVASLLISFTTQNLTPTSGGYLAILAPAAPVTATVDVFNLGAEWSASNTAVATGSAGQFDVFVNTANAHVVVDILGYFRAPQGGVVTSITAGAGLTGGTITSTGTIAADTAVLQARVSSTCAAGSSIRAIAADGTVTCQADGSSGGTVTGVSASAPLASSGGTAPNISLTGAVPVASGGTGATTLATNGIVYGQGTGPLATAVGAAGQVLSGTAGAPAWTGSPSISGNLTLVDSTATTGNVFKGANLFIHNFGPSNTFIGVNAGNFSTEFNNQSNTGAGFGTLSANTSGQFNTASGNVALTSNTSGHSNTASGSHALKSNTTGFQNTASGTSALESNTTGFANTASGTSALYQNTTGYYNIAVGSNAGYNHSTGDHNIAIGNEGVAAESGTTRIGTNGAQERAFIAGIHGVTTGIANAVPVLIDGNGQLGTSSASRQAGEASVGTGAVGVNVYTVTFPKAFASAPKVIVTPKTDLFGMAEVSDTFAVSIRAISTTQFKANVYRVDVAGGAWSVNLRLEWMAWE